MITLYSGTPGSGKSYHVAKDIISKSKKSGGIILNFQVDVKPLVKEKDLKAEIIYKDNSDLTVEYLIDYAVNHHVVGKEHQSLIVIDEAQVKFNCREFGNSDRRAWVEFYCKHRHFGYDVILITQNERLLDKQIRYLLEYEVVHKKVNNNGIGGMLFNLTGRTWFCAITKWYGTKGKDANVGYAMFPYNKKYGKIYNSYMMFSEYLKKKDGQKGNVRQGSGGDREAVGSPGELTDDTPKSVIIKKQVPKLEPAEEAV